MSAGASMEAVADAVGPARQRLSRVRRPLGAITWYVEGDHLLAADQRWFQMQYRRVYFADVRSVAIWPNRALWWRIGAEAAVAWLVAWLLWFLRAHTAAAAAVAALGAAAMLAELVLGPRASAVIVTRHSTYKAPLVARWGGAEALLARLAALLPAAAEEAGE